MLLQEHGVFVVFWGRLLGNRALGGDAENMHSLTMFFTPPSVADPLNLA